MEECPQKMSQKKRGSSASLGAIKGAFELKTALSMGSEMRYWMVVTKKQRLKNYSSKKKHAAIYDHRRTLFSRKKNTLISSHRVGDGDMMG
jgi:hypothetical protein